MSVRTRIPLLLLIGSGCSDLSDEEIDALLVDQLAIVSDLEARLDEIESLVEASPQGHGEGDGDYLYQGTISPGAAWSAGVIEVDGTGTAANNGTLLSADLRLTYVGVERSGTTYDGVVAVQTSIATGDGLAAISYVYDGELDAAGTVDGHAVLDYAYASSSSDGGAPHYEGTIDGTDVTR